MSNEIDMGAEVLKLTKRWRETPMLYLDECLGVQKIWKLQSDVMDVIPRAMAEHKPIVIGSGHALGKDFICSGCVSNWFLDCFIPSKVILTGPSDRQVKKIQWAECLARFNNKKIRLWGRAFTTPFIEIRPEDWFLMGFATKETGASADAGGGKFQGLRGATNMCIIVTEAQAVEDNIFTQIDAIATAENCLIIYIGNPTRAKGQFAKMLKDKKRNIVFNFSCLENPNYIHRKIMVPGLATYQWVEDKRSKWGEDDPRWIGRVLGQVPENSMSNTFPERWVNHTSARFGFLAVHSVDGGVAVDSAGEGDDENVILSGKGGEPVDIFTKTLMTPSEVAHKAVEMCKAVNGKFIIFDCDGVGIRDYQEACQLPREYLRGIQLIKFHGSSSKTTQYETMADPVTGKEIMRPIYANMRAEASFVTRDAGFAGKCAVNYRDEEMLDDLREETFFENKKGLIQIEDKKDIKDRLDRSPGRGDAYKMLIWAFQQDIEDKTYADSQVNQLPTYGQTDSDVAMTAPSLPQYGDHN